MKDFIAAVAAIVINEEGEIMMVKEGKEHVKGLWDFPGGAIEDFETIKEATRREVLEETGFETEFQKLVGVYFCKSQSTGRPSIDFLVESKIVGEAEKDMDFDKEILDEKFFRPEEIEDLELRKENRYRMFQDFVNGQEMDIEKVDYSEEFT